MSDVWREHDPIKQDPEIFCLVKKFQISANTAMEALVNSNITVSNEYHRRALVELAELRGVIKRRAKNEPFKFKGE